jgi:hypothetical protein
MVSRDAPTPFSSAVSVRTARRCAPLRPGTRRVGRPVRCVTRTPCADVRAGGNGGNDLPTALVVRVAPEPTPGACQPPTMPTPRPGAGGVHGTTELDEPSVALALATWPDAWCGATERPGGHGRCTPMTWPEGRTAGRGRPRHDAPARAVVLDRIPDVLLRGGGDGAWPSRASWTRPHAAPLHVMAGMWRWSRAGQRLRRGHHRSLLAPSRQGRRHRLGCRDPCLPVQGSDHVGGRRGGERVGGCVGKVTAGLRAVRPVGGAPTASQTACGWWAAQQAHGSVHACHIPSGMAMLHHTAVLHGANGDGIRSDDRSGGRIMRPWSSRGNGRPSPLVTSGTGAWILRVSGGSGYNLS